MPTPASNWTEFYKATQAFPPSKLLVRALEYVNNTGKALDIGGGALKDTRYLLEKGFHVTTIDKEAPNQSQLNELLTAPFEHILTRFVDFDFPIATYDVVNAMFSLPFNAPREYEPVFSRVKASLKSGGILCMNFFGDRDEWSSSSPLMTFHTKEQALQSLDDFEILYFSEYEEDSQTALGTPKHWHTFRVIAKQP